MSDNLLTFYISLEVLFHVILCSVFCAFPTSYRFRLWLVLRVAFSAWPTLYMVYEYLDMAQPQSALLVHLRWSTFDQHSGVRAGHLRFCNVY